LPLILDNVPRGLRQALLQEGVPFRNRNPAVPEGRFILVDSKKGPWQPPSNEQVVIDVDLLREGCGVEPFEALEDLNSIRFEWYVGELRLAEEIARFDKRRIRQKILSRLRAIVEKSGGIWLRVSPFPFPYRSALNFRIDYDNYDPDDFSTTLQAISGNETATSHYVNASAYENVNQALSQLRGLDVGSHGYWHHTYRTKKENSTNIKRGVDRLRESGLEPSGFVAPHGRFCSGLLAALVDLGITHSSEFGLAYDELPFLPGNAGVLQIPIHPVSLGLFLDAARLGKSKPLRHAEDIAADSAIGYFEQVLNSNYRSGRPVFLYGHPTGRLGRYPQLLRRVFETANQFCAIWKTTLTQFNDWWRARSNVDLEVWSGDHHYVIRTRHRTSKYHIGVEYFRGRHVALMPLREKTMRFSPDSLAYENRSGNSIFRPVRVDRSEGVRSHICRLVDWERVTPTDEIQISNWRNLVKRTLRHLWKK